MHASYVHDALTQTLENYQRCGLRRFSRENEVPFEILDALRNLQDQADAAVDPPTVASANSVASANAVALDVTKSGHQAASTSTVTRISTSAGTSVSPPSSVGVIGQSGAWELPNLDVPQREAHFATLAAQASECRKCQDIVTFRQQTVFGSGNLQPVLCFVGEAPGADEDRLGQPFVGAAGKLLTKIIAAMKMDREEVYILNALKCRPPSNRTPVPDEIENCHHFVTAQLDILQPKYIVCLGAVAIRSILQSTDSIGRLRGRFHQYRGAKVVATYHPSYLLRNESVKRLVWDDMQMLMREMKALS
ncbi:MAG: uracil-DNA glycosylase [Pirellulaceae bacterium]